MLKQGWLDRQIHNASENIKSWPEWMRREAKINERTTKSIKESKSLKEAKVSSKPY